MPKLKRRKDRPNEFWRFQISNKPSQQSLIASLRKAASEPMITPSLSSSIGIAQSRD